MGVPNYSIVIPVYNRPQEIDELLASLTQQSYKDFEVIVVEDGSKLKCEDVLEKYSDDLNVKYFFKENSGQGFSRNYGFEKAAGEWLIVFDSDCIIPSNYLQIVNNYLNEHDLDAYGGPDKASPDFTHLQKAISYSMTSFFTTGGIRGNKNHVGEFHPRSFNMGIRKEVFEKTNGYLLPKKGEDIEFSIRIIKEGFKTGLIEEAFVYHKRRTSLWRFFKQLHFFGTARINVFRHHKGELKLLHFFPVLFLVGLIASLILIFMLPILGKIGLISFGIYALVILLDSTIKERSLFIGILSVLTSFTQLMAYGLGLLKESLIYLLRG